MLLSGVGTGDSGSGTSGGVYRTGAGGGSPMTMPEGVPGTGDPPPPGRMVDVTGVDGCTNGGVYGAAVVVTGGPVMMVVPMVGEGIHMAGGASTGA